MRDDFDKGTLDTLAKRVGVRCSNPACKQLTTGPRTDSAHIVNIGVGAHITAASPGGPRFDPALSAAERRSADNGIWLCQNHGKLVDNDDARYTVEVLRDWKRRAEAAALVEVEGGPAGRVPDLSAEIEISFREEGLGKDRHDYRLEVKLRNLGTEPLGEFHIDLEFPARVIERPRDHNLYVPERSSRDVALFRVHSRQQLRDIYPGDTTTVMTLDYYMDDKLYFAEGVNVRQQPVRATLYRRGCQPLSVERLFDEFEVF